MLEARCWRAGVLITARALPLVPATAGAGQVLPGRATPGFFFGPPWRVVKVVMLRPSAGFADIAAAGRNEALAIGVTFRGVRTVGSFAVQWNGRRWRRVAFPIRGFIPVSVSAKGNSGAWVFGYVPPPPPQSIDRSLAFALVLKAGHWRIIPLPNGPRLSWVMSDDLQSAVASARDAWVAGSTHALSGEGVDVHSVLWHWNGSAWLADSLSVAEVTSISAVSRGDAWAVGDNRAGGRTAAFRWRRRAWARVRIPAIARATVAADSFSSVWIAGEPLGPGDTALALHWSGQGWHRLVAPVDRDFGSAAADGRGGVWLGMEAHWTGGRWLVPSRLPFWRGCNGIAGNPAVASIPGTRAAWLVGNCPPVGHLTRLVPFLAINGRLQG